MFIRTSNLGQISTKLSSIVRFMPEKVLNFIQPWLFFFLFSLIVDIKQLGGCPRGVMVKVMDCGIVVSEFVLQSRYYIHFRTNTLGKRMNPLILPAMD